MLRTIVHQSDELAERRRPDGLLWVQRAVAFGVAATMAVDAYVHLHDAAFYDLVGTNAVSQGTLFRIEGVVAVVAAVVLLIWPRPITWAASLVVAGSAFGAVMLYTYVKLGALGPLPNMFEPTWALPGKLSSAWAEAIGTSLALVGLFLSVSRPKTRGPRDATAASNSTTLPPAVSRSSAPSDLTPARGGHSTIAARRLRRRVEHGSTSRG